MSDQTPKGDGGLDAREKAGGTERKGGLAKELARVRSGAGRWMRRALSLRSVRVAAVAAAVLVAGAGAAFMLYGTQDMGEGRPGPMFTAVRETAEAPSQRADVRSVRAEPAAEPVFVAPAPPARPVPEEAAASAAAAARPTPEAAPSRSAADLRATADGGGRESDAGAAVRRPVLHVMPAAQERIVQGPGWRRHPVYKEWRYQPGVEFALPRGSDVKAAGAGVVVFAGYDERWGLTVRVRHDDGWLSVYGYLEDILVADNVRVEGGDVIGRSGLAPWHEPRLFFGVWKDGAAVDPVPLLTR